jgi:NADPH-dependent 2,4-dienoyl-CoA reductase/sulfur reductase-like enzyme/nitrite reductase/ring-hydroxylating ferredoxin subunit
MADDDRETRPDLREGISASSLQDGGMIGGRVDADEVVLARSGDEFFAVGAHCTHYHGALADGLIVGETVRCPLHHACFSLRTGEPLRAPALDAIACWRVERRGDTLFVREKLAASSRRALTSPNPPPTVVILGGGGAGLAAADMLRREGYDGPVTMISADDSPPCDRPNLSKDYLSGEAQEDWIPLRPPEFYTDNRIELLLGRRVTSIDPGARELTLEGGERRRYGALLVATGADPVRLPTPGVDGPQVHYLRSFADSRAIIAKAAAARHAVVIGGSFIGLEVAASLRTRGVAVDVVARERLPLERTLGPELGQVIRHEHESHGVIFHPGETVTRIDGRSVALSGGGVLDADFVVVGVGVRPALALAERAGLAVDRGISVNEYLETSAPGIFAAGDVARWLDRRSGERRRIEHWVVAERQGQTAARNILGAREPFDAVPFFWSQHYDLTVRYVGYAEAWDKADIRGNLAERSGSVTFRQHDRKLAVATIGLDRENLAAELELENAKNYLTT